ncbi:hypothetical protein B7P43_G09127 [Cryptotermes secundus]|nr:hypothetical protein B7P43_G09127 [Cryptotermes secundus]
MKRCPRPTLLNGQVRVMSRGRTAKFRCNQTFQLLGEKYATCLRGVWDTIPICVKSGCVSLPYLKNGQVVESYRGAVVKFLCNPGYSLFGSSIMYCNGAVWNGTIPECKASEKIAQTWCDFESQDLCGWTQDPHHNFDWSRQNFQALSGSVDTGPSFDHTLGPGRGGYYMFIGSSSHRMENDTARLYSPVYGSQLTSSQPSCFIFWYHMYGATTGSLHVYMKPENTEFGGSLLPRFTKSGEQGNQWYQGIVLLPSTNESFQIIIEAVRGAGYVSDTAIDDVKIANGSECLAIVTNAPSLRESVNQNGGSNEIYDSTQSCRLRCTIEQFAGTHTTASASETPIFAECECHLGCLQTATCCPDYASYCMLVAPTEIQKVTKPAIVSRPYHTPPPLPPLPPFPSVQLATTSVSTNTYTFEMTSKLLKPLENPTVPVVTYKPTQSPWTLDGLKGYQSSTTELNKRIPIPTDPTPLILQRPTKKPLVISHYDKPAVQFTSVKPTTTSVTPHFAISSHTDTQRIDQAVSELNKTAVTKSVNILSSKALFTAITALKILTVSIPRNSSVTSATEFVPKQSSTTPKTTPVTQKYPKVIQLTRKPAVVSVRPVTSLKETARTSAPAMPPPIILQSTVARNTQDITEQLNYPVSTTELPWMKVTRGQKWMQARRGPVPRRKEFLSSSVIVGILVAVILIITAIAIATYFVVRNRRRVHRQQCMADDSDVRFLTSDEALDFSLARPIDSNDDYL